MPDQNETHAKFSPSQLPRIIRCPGSVKLTAHISSDTSPYAEEGTMLHEVTEVLLRKREYKVPDLWKKKFRGEKASEPKFSLDEEQVDAVNDCLDFVFTLVAKHEVDVHESIEAKVSLIGFAEEFNCPELADVYGTVDYKLTVIVNKHLYIIDWKFGKGIEVFPDSEQLSGYALAGLKNPNILKNFDLVTIIVGQPRLYGGDHFKELETTPQELYNWCERDLVPALKATNSVKPILNPSDKACQWCKIKMTCKARREQNTQTAMEVFKVHADIPDKVNIEEMLELRRKGKDLIKFLKDIDKYLVNRLINAKEVPGYKMVAGRSIRVWKDEDTTRRYLLNDLELEWDEIHGDAKFKSPAQMEKVLGRQGSKEKDFTELIHKPVGKATMVIESDKREALKYESAEDKFADFKER